MIVKNREIEATLEHYFKNYNRQFNVYFDIDFPILFSFENRDNIYLCYTLDFDELEEYLEYIVVESNYKNIHKLITQKESIRNLLGYGSAIKICMNDQEIESKEICINDIDTLLPTKEYKLSYLLPNKVNLQEVQLVIENKLRLQEIFINNTEWREISTSNKYSNYRRSILSSKEYSSYSISSIDDVITEHIYEVNRGHINLNTRDFLKREMKGNMSSNFLVENNID